MSFSTMSMMVYVVIASSLIILAVVSASRRVSKKSYLEVLVRRSSCILLSSLVSLDFYSSSALLIPLDWTSSLACVTRKKKGWMDGWWRWLYNKMISICWILLQPKLSSVNLYYSLEKRLNEYIYYHSSFRWICCCNIIIIMISEIYLLIARNNNLILPLTPLFSHRFLHEQWNTIPTKERFLISIIPTINLLIFLFKFRFFRGKRIHSLLEKCINIYESNIAWKKSIMKY